MASMGHVGILQHSCQSIEHLSTAAKVVIISVLVVVKLCVCLADDSFVKEPLYFDQLYAQGVKAYNDQLWYKCAYNLENAVKDYRTFKKTLTDCRVRCKKQGNQLDSWPSDLGEFAIFETFLKHADCFRRCKSDAYERRPGFKLSKKLDAAFALRKPYQYLQFCLYKLDRLKEAASASYTYFLKNPHDEEAKGNIVFYRDRAKVPESNFLDMELSPYKEHYIRAMLAYGDEDWLNMVDNMEKGLEEFFIEEERCRADCEDEMDTSDASHFSGIVADHFLKVLECQLGCEGNLSVIYTVPITNFLAEQFHYLQFAYYKMNKIPEAVETTASYLLFHPDDEVVKDNKNIFKTKFQIFDEQFKPRKAVQEYVERRQKQQTLLDILQVKLMKEVPDVIVVSDLSSGEDEREQQTDNFKWMERYERLGLHVIAKERDLHRPYRFAADGLLKQEQCDDILTLMENVAVDGKGVQTFTLAHGRENIIHADESYEASLRLFLRATEVTRHYTQRYYNLSSSLYFKNTSMVCWRQIEEPQVENDCIPQEFGTCDPESKIRDMELIKDQFVTATYLNTLDDGDVYFLGENISIVTSLGVKQGRTIGFQSGDRHGLHIPASGPRCAIVITYTTYSSEDEKDYINTIRMLQRLEEVRMERGILDQKKVMKNFENMGVHVIRNSSALQGGERFVADGLSSDAECTSLKNMVMDLGKVGDGYGGQQSPHTQNELFAGLNLKQLSQSGALVGDGYDHLEVKPSYISPHTEHEMFQGLTIYRAAKLMYMGLVNTFTMQSFLGLSEKSRLFVEKYFNLTQPLYFDFTHLVCRSAIDDSKERDDLSHPVHADNCVLKPDGSCVKEYPAFTQRDYSAILYLNDDFEGGEFFFAHANKSEQASLRPQCGRLVGFNAAEYHGVKAVRSGVRCALALWFTLNPNYKELAHIHARKVLRTILKERESQEKLLEKGGVDAVKNGEVEKITPVPEVESEDNDISRKETGEDFDEKSSNGMELSKPEADNEKSIDLSSSSVSSDFSDRKDESITIDINAEENIGKDYSNKEDKNSFVSSSNIGNKVGDKVDESDLSDITSEENQMNEDADEGHSDAGVPSDINSKDGAIDDESDKDEL